MLKLLLCDAQKLNRTTLKGLIERESDIVVVHECDTADQALRGVRETDPDLILLDAGLGGMGAIELTRRLERVSPTLQTIVLGVQQSGPYVLRLLEAGADGYVTRCSPFADLLEAIHTVSAGERYLAPATARLLALASASAELSPLGQLTPREMAVLLMVSKGQRRQEISRHLSLSPKTVSTYRSRVLKKLGVRSDVELTHLSLSHGLLDT
jgi:two-component system invasion response regulator UvrY